MITEDATYLLNGCKQVILPYLSLMHLQNIVLPDY